MPISREEFEELYRARAPEILGYLRRHGAGDDAQDLLAETFLIAWRRQADLPAPQLWRAWLFGTARRLLLVHHRTARPLPLPGRLPAAGSDQPGGDDVSALVHLLLAELSEVDRELLTMTAWEGLSVAEAATALGLGAGAARVRLHRARRRLAADSRLAPIRRETLSRSSEGVSP